MVLQHGASVVRSELELVLGLPVRLLLLSEADALAFLAPGPGVVRVRVVAAGSLSPGIALELTSCRPGRGTLAPSAAPSCRVQGGDTTRLRLSE